MHSQKCLESLVFESFKVCLKEENYFIVEPEEKGRRMQGIGEA